MDLRKNTIKSFENALPGDFEFYHLGSVEQQPKSAFNLENFDFSDKTVLGFSMKGELKGAILVFFDHDLDCSIYSELGNILAGKIVTRLGQTDQIDVMISPPEFISHSQAKSIISGISGKSRKQFLMRKYQHLYNNRCMPIEILILPFAAQGAGNA